MSITEVDRSTQEKALEEMKTVKGLVDSGITEIPAMFHAPPSILATLKAPPQPSQKLTIPTTDLKGGRVHYKNQDLITRQCVVQKIREAAEKWGFLQVINHGIKKDVLDRVIEGVRGFHEQDQEVKRRFYSRDYTKSVIYTSNFDLRTSPPANWRDTLGCYMAPDPPRLEDFPAVCGEIMLEYSKEMVKLGEFISELLSEALGLKPNHLKDMGCVESLITFGQYYPPCPQPDLTLGLNKHSNFSFLTLLLQGDIGGLQVLHDQYWIDIPPVPGALVINVGDLLQFITNDRFISAEHRVLANGASTPRISVPCFFSTFMKANPRVYGPIKELLSDENPPKYRDCSITEFSEIFKSKELSSSALLHLRI